VQLEGPFSEASEMLNGQSVIAIHGYAPGPPGKARVRAVLDVITKRTTPPVAFQESDGQVAVSARWTKWGDPVALVAPQDPIPVSELGS
jgi:hypothetical protein